MDLAIDDEFEVLHHDAVARSRKTKGVPQTRSKTPLDRIKALNKDEEKDLAKRKSLQKDDDSDTEINKYDK